MVQLSQQPAPAQEAELPIDIDYAKFLPWLVDRRRVPRDWHTYLKSARALVRHAAAITPPSAQAHLNLHTPSATDTPISYFRSLDLLAALTAPDAPSDWLAGPEKDLLGRYKGATARAWSEAVAAFEKRDVYLADSAQLLSRNVDVEAPALKAAIARHQNEVNEYARRDAPTVKAAAEARERFEIACAEFDLPSEGDADFQALLAVAIERKVPELLEDAVRTAKDKTFVEAVEYYSRFAGYVAKEVDQVADVPCASIRAVMDGDTNSLTRTVQKESVSELGHESDGCVMDVGISAEENSTVEHCTTGTDEIDWGIEVDTSGAGAASSESPSRTAVETTGGIEWDIGVEEENESDGFGVGAVGNSTLAGEEEFSLVDPQSRERYLNDLTELDAFLAQRAVELSRSGNSEIQLVAQQATGTPDFVRSVDVEKISAMQVAVQKAIVSINSASTRRVLALRTDAKRLERAARSVLEKKHIAERIHASIDVVRKRRTKSAADLATEALRFDELAKNTKDVQGRTEEKLSSLYKGRRVNILGEINHVFPPND